MTKSEKSAKGCALFGALVLKNGGAVVDFARHNDYLCDLETVFAAHVLNVHGSDWTLHAVNRDGQIDKRMCIACF